MSFATTKERRSGRVGTRPLVMNSFFWSQNQAFLLNLEKVSSGKQTTYEERSCFATPCLTSNCYTNSPAASLISKMKLSLKQKKPLAKDVENTDSAKTAEPPKAAVQGTIKTASTGKTAIVATAQHKKPRRVIRPRPQHATPLDTIDDDDYDDCWLPAYEDPRPTDKLVDDGWVSVKKPASGR
ncbi:hypothetical protein LZ30DRAFT_142570 [Colletotrichum cereale]|nr:hypothetical protein LZ30DRAFT_142570 [Colletotrichum cereale]